MVRQPQRLNRVTVILLALAALFAVVQFALSFVVRVVARPREAVVGSSAGGRAHAGIGVVNPPTKTYFGAFGPSEVMLTAVVIGVVALVGYLLHRRLLTGRPGAGPAAWAVSIAAALPALIGFAYLWGAAICLLLACTTMTRGRTRAAPSAAPRAIVGAG